MKALERQQPAPHIRVQWTGDAATDWEARLLEGGPALVPNMLRREGLPQRLAEALCLEAGVPLDRCGWGAVWWGVQLIRQTHNTPSMAAAVLLHRLVHFCPPASLSFTQAPAPRPPPVRKLAELRKSERAALVAALTQYALPITGHEGYAKAEVSCCVRRLWHVHCNHTNSS